LTNRKTHLNIKQTVKLDVIMALKSHGKHSK